MLEDGGVFDFRRLFIVGAGLILKLESELSEGFLSKIENIIFDLGGVIVGLDESQTKEKFKNLLGLVDYSNGAHVKHFHDIETGTVEPAEFRRNLRQLAFLNGKEYPNDKDLDQAWNSMILKVPTKNVDLLRRLREDYNIFLLSNTNAIHLHYFMNHAFENDMDFVRFERLFKATYYSHKIGCRKPSREAYQIILDDHDLNPEKTLFVDDNLPNFSGAVDLGIRCFHLVGDLTDLPLLKG